MTCLLDVNILIALCDEYHAHHEAAHRWFGSIGAQQWATCPITENGFIRITGKSSYPRSFGRASLQMNTLKKFCSLPNHPFWPDDISVLQSEIWTDPKLIVSTHLTDLYLLALAVKKGGKLLSFDRTIPAHLIRGGKEALVVLSV